MRRTRRSLIILAGSAVTVAVLTTASLARPLTNAKALATVYRQILDADPDLEADLRSACTDAPPEACRVLSATGLWWQIQLDPASRALDDQFLFLANAAIEDAEAWVAREPTRAEAWFYLGGGYAARVQWRVLREERLAAARDGKRIKEALERAVQLDPTLDDAFFGLGLYQYYADVAPTAAKILRFLLFLPGGDRVQGLQNMLRVRERGALMRGEADYQLAIIYLWYEKQPERALELLQGLRDTHPRNPAFIRQIAEVQDSYFHDLPASLQTYRALLTAAEQKRVNAAPLAAADARLGAARQLDALYETDRAIELLRSLIADNPAAPFAAVARAHLQLGAAYDRLGQRDAAVSEFQAAQIAAPARDPYNVWESAKLALRRASDPRAAEAYRLSLEGWRLFERQQLADAEAALVRSTELKPSDAVTHYRYGRVLAARQHPEAALAQLRRALALRASAPAPILAAAAFEAARLVERSGNLEEAAALYEQAARIQGGGADVQASARRALARLRATPPRRVVR